MASFTFGAGNARKLLGLPLYAVSALVGLAVPRSDRLWVFGSGTGPGEGALPLYRLARERLDASVRLVWLAGSEAELAEARALGLDTAPRAGLRGLWLTMRAQVVVVTHGFGDANRYGTRGAFVVQLWHGLPFKHLHLDSPATYRVASLPDVRPVRALLAVAYRLAGRGLSLFPVSSARVAPSIVSAFGIRTTDVVVTGDPRDDVLLAGAEPARRAAAHAVLGEVVPDLPEASHVVLFAPTWRDGEDDPSVPSDAEWDAVADTLERLDAALLVRTHPLGRGDYAGGPARSARIRLVGPGAVRDVNRLLWAVDAVVTDYSSIVFDYALVGGPVVFLAPDLDAYTSTRGFYLPFTEFSGGRAVRTWPEALARLEEALAEDEDGPGHRHAHRLRVEYFDVPDGRATARVLDVILRRTGHPGLPDMPSTDDVTARPVVRDARLHLDPAAVVLRVQGTGRVSLVGPRARVEAETQDGTVRLPLLQSRWGSAPLALPSGTYRLELADGTTRLELGQARIDGVQLRHDLFRAQLRAEAGGIVVDVRAQLADDEVGRRAQARLARDYRRSRPTPEKAVFLESFRGRAAACNPLGIDRALAEMRPDVRRYWSVRDGSVAVPDGAVRVVEGSREWWRARAAARVLVVNDWLRLSFRRRDHQHVLQTWHGSTLKRLARDRLDAGPRSRLASRLEGRRWDALLAQNDFSAQNLRSAYAFGGPVWVTGYPRDDVLSRPERADDVRTRLGLPAGVRVVLYAPTWREHRTQMVDALDPGDLAASLGDDHVVLLRGHSSTWEHGRDRHAPGVIDVTGYPDVSDLLLVADILVTDYSSVMFDWLTTGRPVVFFVPDLAHYRDAVRGFYTDLLADPPGPVVRTPGELRDALAHADRNHAGYADVLAAWRQRFTPHDDGEAGARTVRRMTDAGWFT